MRLSRRSIIRTGILAAAAPALGRLGLPALAQEASKEAPPGAPQWRHGLALLDEPRYAEGFKHFDYVNPAAPKAGGVRMSAPGTFDNFNPVVAGVKGKIAVAVGHLFDTLMFASRDEVAAEYGLLAESVSFPPDVSSATYRLRAEAKWQDGKPVTPEDVVFSFDAFKRNSPRYSAYYRHVAKAEKTGAHEVTFTFETPGNRELPFIVGELTVLPKHWWEGSDSSGKKRDVTATTLEPPLASGPYRIKSFAAGRNIVLERVKDYWGKDVNVKAGTENFETITYEYFRDSTVELEAFKGDQVDWRTEASAKNWATAYDFPAVRDHRVVQELFPIRNIGRMQAFVFNTRRDKFQDARVRQAFDFAYDFEEMNKQLFYGQYRRITSYFDGTELASSGLPQGLELEILQTVRDRVPPEVFTKEYTNPVSGNPEAVRNNLRESIRLLKEAGYEVRDRRLVNAKTNAPYVVEILVDDPALERIALFYKPSLERLGMAVTVRTIDDAQFENRTRSWDFDVIMPVWGESLSPGNEQREYWGSQSADVAGSENYVGIKNPAVDAMIDKVIFAKNRDELIAATHALDRVLLWNHYVVPQFTFDKSRTARWDRFSHPDPMPKYGISDFPSIWWWDEAKAAKTGSRQ
ncbi:MAG TPA: extracellular solute-binding protein [Xanthobacteraceae bacterium]